MNISKGFRKVFTFFIVSMLMIATLQASENISWQTKSLSAGKVDIVTGAYKVQRSLGVANLSSEFAMPIELVYDSKSDKTGIFGYRWNAPQLESRMFPKKDSVQWVTPWGEQIPFFKKSEVKKNEIAEASYGDALDGKGYFSPFSEWEALGEGGDWVIRGRPERSYKDWKFTYNNSRLTKIESPYGRNIKFRYDNDKLTSIVQDGTAFVKLAYNKDILKSITINGIKTQIDLDKIKTVTLPKKIDQPQNNVERPALASIQYGTLEPEKFSYNDHGFLTKCVRGQLVDEMQVATVTFAERMKNLQNELALGKDDKKLLEDYKKLLELSRDPAEKLTKRQEAGKKADELWSKISKLRNDKKIATGSDNEGKLLKDRNFTYAIGKNSVTLTNVEGQKASYSFNMQTGVMNLTNFAGQSQTIYYYRRHDVAYNGKLRKVVDGRNRVVANYRYDNETGNVTRVTTMTGNEAFYRYNKNNQLSSISRLEKDSADPLRVLVKFGYDKKGNPDKVSLLDVNGEAVVTTSVEYDKDNQPVKVITPEGNEEIAYTSAGRVYQVKNRFGHITTRKYDKYNRLESATDFYGSETKISYNSNGQIEKITRYSSEKNDLGVSPVLASVSFAYNNMGATTTITDQSNRTKKFDRDIEGRIIKKYFPNNTSIGYSYTSLGQLSKVEDRRENPITFAWAKYGSLSCRTTAVGQQNIYEHDSYGLITGVKSVDKDGKVDRHFKYSHDEFDRISEIDYGQGRTKQYERDFLGRITKITAEDNDKTKTLEMAYDQFDRVVKKVESVGNEQTVYTYKYTNTGKRSSMTIAMSNGEVITETSKFDKFGRLVSKTQNGKTLEYMYDEYSRVAQQTIDGRPIAFTYDYQGRLLEKKAGYKLSVSAERMNEQMQKRLSQMFSSSGSGYTAAAAPTASLQYIYSADNQIEARIINGKRQNFKYDSIGQLTLVSDEAGKTLESYTYDNAGNILQKTVNGVTTKFTFDAANQIKTEIDAQGNVKEYSYDAAGRMVKAGEKEYKYGWLDKVLIVDENGKTIAEYDYHISGQLAGVSKADGNQESFTWDGLALIKRNQTNLLNEPYVTGGNPVLAWEGNTAEAKQKTFFNDMLGSTIATLEDGSATESNLTLFGEQAEGKGVESNDSFFTGKPNVDGLGYAFLFRNYQPNQGKWQTADPLGYPDGANNFAYCNNRVASHLDWLGTVDLNLFPEDEDISGYADNADTDNYTVGGHGNANGVYDADGELIPAAELAEMIQNDENYNEGDTVDLLSCNVGNGDYAQELANALGATVNAPNNYVWYYPDGTTTIAGMNDDGTMDEDDLGELIETQAE